MKHETAQKFLVMAQDGALSARDAELLGQHLRQCVGCRAIAREMEELETQLRYRLKVRYPTVSAAEIAVPRARLKAALTPRYPAIRQFAPLAAGIAALVVLISALLYATQILPQEMTVRQTSTVVAAIVTELPTATNEPTPTAELLPTDEPSATAEPLPSATPTVPVPTEKAEIAPTETVIVVPTETVAPPAPTANPPTAVPTATPTTVPPTAVPPTETPTVEPTSAEPNEETAKAQLDAYIAALNGESAETILTFFSPITHYGTGEGRKTLERELLSAEFNALRTLSSHFSLDKCRSTLRQNGQAIFTASCELTMTNDWRKALGLAPYVSQFSISLDDDLAISSLLDYQYREGIAADWNDVQAFQEWLSINYMSVQRQYMSGNPANYLRHINLALLPYAQEWVTAGRP